MLRSSQLPCAEPIIEERKGAPGLGLGLGAYIIGCVVGFNIQSHHLLI